MANRITIARILLIPVFMLIFLAPWPDWFFGGAGNPTAVYVDKAILPWVAAAAYAFLALTDGIDGHIARSRNEVTVLGKFMDPLADKILVAAALIALVELRDIPSWVALVIISREFIVSGLRMLAATRGVVIAAQMSGKVKTTLTLIAIILFIIKRSDLIMGLPTTWYRAIYGFSWLVMLAAIVMTIVSMLVYFNQSAPLLRGDKNEIELVFEEAGEIVEKATEKGVHIAVAESLTGGRLGSVLTSIPGSSAVFEGGVISYSSRVKNLGLGVSEETIAQNTSVSEQVAIEMVRGVESRFLSAFDDDKRIAISVTGVAGPGPDSDGNPQGRVWIGVTGMGETIAKQFDFEGEREEVRRHTAFQALSLILERLDG